MPKGSHCPFELTPTVEEDPDDKKESTISFKKPIDPVDPDGIKLSHNAKVCDSTFIEDILKHELQFAQLQVNLNLDTIVKRKAVYEATLSPSLQTT